MALFKAHQQRAEIEDRARDSMNAERKRQRQLERERMSGVLDDDPCDVRRLEGEFGLAWTSTLAERCSRAQVLGPQSGISDVRRLLRGLDLGILTAHSCRNEGAYMHAPHGTGTFEGRELIKHEKTARAPTAGANNCCMFGTSDPACLPFPSDAQWQRNREADRAAATAAAVRTQTPQEAKAFCVLVRQTYCTTCMAEVMQQFGECACVSTWEWCPVCGAACHHQQSCACRAEAEWERRQAPARTLREEAVATGAGAGAGWLNEHGDGEEEWAGRSWH